MTETNPYDPDGPEIVLIHSSQCPEHPEFDEFEVSAQEGIVEP